MKPELVESVQQLVQHTCRYLPNLSKPSYERTWKEACTPPRNRLWQFQRYFLYRLLVQRPSAVARTISEAYSYCGSRRAEAINKSWLSDHVIDVVIRFSCSLDSETIVFGRGIGTEFDEDLDMYYMENFSMGRLEYSIKQAQASDSNQDEWNQGQVFTFLSTVKTIVFQWNYTGAHWIVVKLDIDLTSWKHTLYNSYNQGAKGPAWNSIVQQMPHLEKLIRIASGLVTPLKESTFHLGVIAISNLLTLLGGREPTSGLDTDSNALRLKYANLVLKYRGTFADFPVLEIAILGVLCDQARALRGMLVKFPSQNDLVYLSACET